jgi:hypothetical protein
LPLSEELRDLGDVNGDGRTNAADAVLILRKVVGSIAAFPRETATKPVVLAWGEKANHQDARNIKKGARERVWFGEMTMTSMPTGASHSAFSVQRSAFLEVPVTLGAGVSAADLTLSYDSETYGETQVHAPEGVLLAVNDERSGEMHLSVARTDAAGPVELRVILKGVDRPPLLSPRERGEGLPPLLRLTGQVFGPGGEPLGEVEALLDRPPVSSLSAPYPNPFNPATTLHYALAEEGEARLTVYNLTGQVVRRLVSGRQSAGRYSVVWDGRDEGGRSVASGLYIVRLKAGVFQQTQKMMLLK